MVDWTLYWVRRLILVTLWSNRYVLMFRLIIGRLMTLRVLGL